MVDYKISCIIACGGSDKLFVLDKKSTKPTKMRIRDFNDNEMKMVSHVEFICEISTRMIVNIRGVDVERLYAVPLHLIDGVKMYKFEDIPNIHQPALQHMSCKIGKIGYIPFDNFHAYMAGVEAGI